jgi:hypothetical protein
LCVLSHLYSYHDIFVLLKSNVIVALNAKLKILLPTCIHQEHCTFLFNVLNNKFFALLIQFHDGAQLHLFAFILSDAIQNISLHQFCWIAFPSSPQVMVWNHSLCLPGKYSVPPTPSELSSHTELSSKALFIFVPCTLSILLDIQATVSKKSGAESNAIQPGRFTCPTLILTECNSFTTFSKF